MTDLAAWLLQQFAEDERVARRANIGRLGPRVLADLAAKRQIVALFMPPSNGAYDRWVGDEVLRILAAPYADRAGYQEAWRP